MALLSTIGSPLVLPLLVGPGIFALAAVNRGTKGIMGRPRITQARDIQRESPDNILPRIIIRSGKRQALPAVFLLTLHYARNDELDHLICELLVRDLSHCRLLPLKEFRETSRK